MRMFIIFWAAVLLGGCNTSKKSTPDDLQLRYDINISSGIVEYDLLRRLYVVTPKEAVYMYSESNKLLFKYANSKKGKIEAIDVSNPLKVIVFYKNNQNAVVLDNTLSVLTQLNLTGIGLEHITAVAAAPDEHYWVFSHKTHKLMKIDATGKILAASKSMDELGISEEHINKITASEDAVILTDPRQGFFIFDESGMFKKHYKADEIRTTQFDGRNIFYYTPTGLKTFNLIFYDKINISIPPVSNLNTIRCVLYSNEDFVEVYPHGIIRKAKSK